MGKAAMELSNYCTALDIILVPKLTLENTIKHIYTNKFILIYYIYTNIKFILTNKFILIQNALMYGRLAA